MIREEAADGEQLSARLAGEVREGRYWVSAAGFDPFGVSCESPRPRHIYRNGLGEPNGRGRGIVGTDASAESLSLSSPG